MSIPWKMVVDGKTYLYVGPDVKPNEDRLVFRDLGGSLCSFAALDVQRCDVPYETVFDLPFIPPGVAPVGAGQQGPPRRAPGT